MSSWRDTLGPAKFRGAEFYVSSSDRSGGRRGPTHEIPFREDPPYREDTGRRGRTFSVEGYCLGADYFTSRDALIRALETPGVGELSHPYHGTLSVAVDSFRVRESSDRGRMATFSIDFIETVGQATQPATVTDAPGALRSSASTAKTAVGSEFRAKFSTTDQPTWTLAALGGVVTGATAKVQSLLAPTLSNAQHVASLRQDLDQIGLDVTELLLVPADLLERLTEGFVTFDFPLTRAGLRALVRAYGFDAGTRPTGSTPARVQQQQNYDALQLLIQRLMLVQAALATLDQTWESYDDAVATRELITDLLDEQADSAADDTYSVLMQLRADLVKAVPGDDSALPRLLDYTPQTTVPSLTLSQRLYGHLDLEADMISRNRIRNPLLVRGGTALQVLSDG